MRHLFTSSIFFMLLNAQFGQLTFQQKAHQLGLTGIPGDGFLGFGVSHVDFDLDGYDDLTIGTEDGTEILFYKNIGGLSFQQVSLGITNTDFQKVVLWADIDNDGDLDLFVGTFGSSNRFYENIGNMVFQDITFASGIPFTSSTTMTACFGDINADGFLDLYYGNWCNQSCNNHLLVSNGDNTFTDITMATGTHGDFGPSLASGFFDYDSDLDADLYVSIDRLWSNKLYENDGLGNFIDASSASNSDTVVCAMNVGMGDINNDRHLDLYVSNGFAGNVLYKNNGDKTFSDFTAQSGTAFNEICWGGIFADYNNDGWQDIYVSNDYDPANHPNKLFLNNPSNLFTEHILPGDTTQSYAVTSGDFNNDGKVDLVTIAIVNDSILYYENQTPSVGNYIKIDATGTISNKDAVGVWIDAFCNGMRYTRYTHSGQAYLAQESQTIHIGLGTANVIDSLIFTWPSGIVDKYFDILPNRKIFVTEDCDASGIISLDNTPIITNAYYHETIHSAGTVSDSIEFYIEECAVLFPSFEVQQSATFLIDIDGCEQ